MTEQKSKGRKGVAVVVGSGGVKCAASVGLWKVFQREGIEVSMAVGSSGGSIYAGIIALGFPAQVAEEMTLDFWTSDLMEGYTSNLRAVLSGETHFTERSGLVDDRPVLERFKRVFGDRTFADTHCPLRIVSTDLYTGETVIHTSGKIVDAIRASMAIPLIYSPCEVDGRLVVDGAASDPLPLDVAIKEGQEIIIAMGFEMPTRTRMRSYTAVTAHFNGLYMNNILKSTFAFYNLAHHAEVIPVLPEFGRQIGIFDAHLIPLIIEKGAQTAEEQLPYIKRLIAEE